MKCPKCGYLGFETGDRCRNCGYDFSLAVRPADAELPLRDRDEPIGLPDDFTFDTSGIASIQEPTGGLDLDRLIGEPRLDSSPFATAEAVDVEKPAREAAAPAGAPAPADVLPLFEPGEDDTPLITAPRPPRAPLAVRRASPEVPKTRTRTTRPVRREEPALTLDLERDDDTMAVERIGAAAPRVPASGAFAPAAKAARAAAAAIDLILLGIIDALVVYFTLRIAELTTADIRLLPVIPMSAFLLLLNGGYLIAFTAGGGQTIGKMATGIQVIGDDGRAVDLAGAILRVAGCVVSTISAGLGYLPAFVTADGRALHDRISGTRVIKA